MPKVVLTSHLARFLDNSSVEVPGATVGEVLTQLFALKPKLEGYLLDDQGGLRKHVVVFVDAAPVSDRVGLSDPVGPSAEVYVMQALSGG